MKNQVIQFFQDLPTKPEAQFNTALDLYRKSQYANANTVRHLNVAGYSPTLLESLLYDLKKLHGITDAMIRSVKAETSAANDPFKLMDIPVFAKGNEGMKQRRDFIKKHELKVSGKKKADLQSAIENYIANVNDDIKAEKEEYEAALSFIREQGIKLEDQSVEAVLEIKTDFDDMLTILEDNDVPVNEKRFAEVKEAYDLLIKEPDDSEKIEITAKDSSEVFPSATEEVKEVIKLRQAYPFLSEDDCPDELKILVADKQTAYEKYVAAHKALLVVVPEGENATAVEMTEEEIFELAKTAVENFEVNQDIFAEMEHYKETGEILGEHPIFIKRKLQEGINAMTMADAAKRQSNLDHYIRRDGKALEKAKNDKDKAKLTKKIKNWKAELDLINAKLGAK